ncbi:MAG: type I-U CRISPR-associated protein Cas5/Cas6 [Deltaproteobacteria bacterium]|nr:type I-U CRISPR-associated protein Cas5/Cas6 [Deltaproteobacteria bacterium]
MIGIKFRFLAGRYHATAWDHQVNEGTVEWPPSPWRLARAMVSAHWWLPEGERPAARRAILALCEVLPRYALPPASLGHTRHYMPTAPKTSKVFDAFAAVGSGPDHEDAALTVGWPGVTLDEEAHAGFRALLPHLGYLGRAESWVLAEEATPKRSELPIGPAEGSAAGTLERMAPPTRAQYAAWLEAFLEESADAKDRTKRKKAAPGDLWALLHVDTGDLFEARWSGPPGVRSVYYEMGNSAFSVQRRQVMAPVSDRPTLARFALRAAVLPPLEHALSVGERARVALMSRGRDAEGSTLAVFHGRGEDGSPLQGSQHAWFLPVDEDQDGYLDHLLVYSREGFDTDAQAALHQLHQLWGRDGHDLHTVLISLGQPQDYGTDVARLAPGRSPALGTARVWESRTPFLLFRHPKQRGGGWVDTPEDQVRLACEQLGLPAPVEIERVAQLPPLKRKSQPTPWYRFYRERKQGGGSRGSDKTYGFRLTFAEPITGPLALGYGAHFGLGQFTALE